MKAAVFVKYKNGLSLPEARKSKGYSQKELSRLTGISISRLQGFENFRRIPKNLAEKNALEAALESLLYSSRDCGGDGCNKGR